MNRYNFMLKEKTSYILKIILFFLFINSSPAPAESNNFKNDILSKVLQKISETYQKRYGDDTFTVIDPKTKLNDYIPKYFLNLDTAKDLIKDKKGLIFNEKDIYLLLKKLVKLKKIHLIYP